jgi:hypothetical protein
MQLRTTPAERECKEENKKGEEKKIRDCIEVSSAALLNTISSTILWG